MSALMNYPEARPHTEHQPRERKVPCQGCGKSTWRVHGFCDPCINGGRLHTTCQCIEGLMATARTGGSRA